MRISTRCLPIGIWLSYLPSVMAPPDVRDCPSSGMNAIEPFFGGVPSTVIVPLTVVSFVPEHPVARNSVARTAITEDRASEMSCSFMGLSYLPAVESIVGRCTTSDTPSKSGADWIKCRLGSEITGRLTAIHAPEGLPGGKLDILADELD